MKKFELTTESIYLLGTKLFRIKALVTFGCVKKRRVRWICRERRKSGSYWKCMDFWKCKGVWKCIGAWR